MTPQKTPLSARLNLFWANMLAPINAYLGTDGSGYYAVAKHNRSGQAGDRKAVERP